MNTEFDVTSAEIREYLESGKIEGEYPSDCLPKKLQSPTTTKSKLCYYEKLDMNLYEKGAHMVGFRTTADRILPWLKALGAYYFEYIGKHSEMKVLWVDNPEKVSVLEPLKNVSIEVSNGDVKLYKITVHIRTGFIQVQGNKFDSIFAQRDFPILLHIVHSLKGPIDLETIPKEEMKTVTNKYNEDEFSEEDETSLLKVDHTNKHVPVLDTNNNTCTEQMIRIEATLVETVQKISVYQQSVENNLEKKIDDLNTLVKDLKNKPKTPDDSVVSKEIQDLKQKVVQLSTEKDLLQKQLQNERSSSALMDASNADALKHEKALVANLRDELKSVITNATNEVEFSNTKMEEKNQEIVELRNQVKDLTKQVSDLQDLNLSLKSQVANMYDEQIHKSKVASKVEQAESETKHGVLIGTSNIKNIDEQRLTHAMEITKIMGYTVQQARQKVKGLTTKPDMIILHILTNDIKTGSPKTCAEDLQTLVGDIIQQWDQIINHTKE
jgi:predicted  nucleic acid-binding Zn-ribbon protein